MDIVKEYESNLVNLIRDLRKKFCPFPFVIANSGFGGFEETNERRVGIMEAQLAVSGDRKKYDDFVGNTFTVETRGFWRQKEDSPSNQGYHWWRNAETYFLIGDSMGKAMISLISK